jgi:hypothetical protein
MSRWLLGCGGGPVVIKAPMNPCPGERPAYSVIRAQRLILMTFSQFSRTRPQNRDEELLF